MASHEAIATMFSLFRETWPKREITVNTARLYHLVLQDIGDDELLQAALACIETCTFWPVPAEIRKHTGEHLTAEMALEIALDDVPLRELPEIIKTVLRNIGGRRMLKERDFIFMRRNFISAYNAIANAEDRQERKERSQSLIPEIAATVKLLERSKDG